MVQARIKQAAKDRSILAFTHAIDKAYNSWGALIGRSFVSGIFIGLGATIGFAIVVAVVGYILGALEVLPIIGDFFSRINIFLQAAIPSTQF